MTIRGSNALIHSPSTQTIPSYMGGGGGGDAGASWFHYTKGGIIHRKLGLINHFRDNCAAIILKTVKTQNNGYDFLSKIES